MSKPGGRRAPKSSTRNPPPPAEEATDRSIVPPVVRGDIETKDDASSNGDKKDTKSGDEATAAAVPAPKPQSAGATIRDAGQRLLSLTMKQEWTSIDPVMKQLEKIVSSGTSEGSAAPLAGVMDPVSNAMRWILFLFCFYFYSFCAMIDDRKDLQRNICHSWKQRQWPIYVPRICCAIGIPWAGTAKKVVRSFVAWRKQKKKWLRAVIDGSITDPSPSGHTPHSSRNKKFNILFTWRPIYYYIPATLRCPCPCMVNTEYWTYKEDRANHIFIKVAQEQDMEIVRIRTLNRNIKGNI